MNNGGFFLFLKMPNLYNPQFFNYEEMLLDNDPQHYKDLKTLVDCPIEPFFLKKFDDAESNSIYIKVYDVDNNVASAVQIKPYYFSHKIIYYIISGLFTNIYLRRMGLATFLYGVLLEHGFSILSDDSHSLPGSMNMWKEVYKIFPENQVYIFNTKTGKRKLYTSQFDYDIWGIDADDDFFLSDEDVKIYTIEEQYQEGSISDEQKDYYIGNIKNLKNLSHIKLMLE